MLIIIHEQRQNNAIFTAQIHLLLLCFNTNILMSWWRPNMRNSIVVVAAAAGNRFWLAAARVAAAAAVTSSSVAILNGLPLWIASLKARLTAIFNNEASISDSKDVNYLDTNLCDLDFSPLERYSYHCRLCSFGCYLVFSASTRQRLDILRTFSLAVSIRTASIMRYRRKSCTDFNATTYASSHTASFSTLWIAREWAMTPYSDC